MYAHTCARAQPTWLPFVLGPALAIDSTPAPVCFSSRRISSSNFPPCGEESTAGQAYGRTQQRRQLGKDKRAAAAAMSASRLPAQQAAGGALLLPAGGRTHIDGAAAAPGASGVSTLQNAAPTKRLCALNGMRQSGVGSQASTLSKAKQQAAVTSRGDVPASPLPTASSRGHRQRQVGPPPYSLVS